MEKFRLVLEKIQDCIEMQNGATESQLKTIWNELSEAITESERRQKVDTGENNALLPRVRGSALLTDLLNAQQEIISSPRRFNGVSIENIKRIFADYGIKYEPPF